MIDFGKPISNRKHLIQGWSQNEYNPETNTTFTWAIGSKAAIRVVLSPIATTMMTMRVKNFWPEQEVTIFVDGVEMGRLNLISDSDWKTYAIVIPETENRPDQSEIEFHFAKFSTTANDTRHLAVLFDSIVFQVINK